MIVCKKIIQKSYSTYFVKIIPDNIISYPFVALIYIRVHNHLPPASEKTSAKIKSNLQSLIEQAIHEDNIVTSKSLISGNKY